MDLKRSNNNKLIYKKKKTIYILPLLRNTYPKKLEEQIWFPRKSSFIFLREARPIKSNFYLSHLELVEPHRTRSIASKRNVSK